MIVIDDSYFELNAMLNRIRAGTPFVPLKEYNPCHDPKTGQFAAKGQGSCEGRGENIVGVTSSRPADTDPVHHRENKVVAQTMHEFAADLRALPGVSFVSVRPALGQWDGGREFSWAVSYNGNGQAKRMIAKLARRWNQDSVIFATRTDSARDNAIFELEFAQVPPGARRRLEKTMAKYLDGWTWHKRLDGRTALRAMSVPDWGGTNRKQALARVVLRRRFQQEGFPPLKVVKLGGYRVSVLYNDGKGSPTYDEFLRKG
jgi:hypothetical protein